MFKALNMVEMLKTWKVHLNSVECEAVETVNMLYMLNMCEVSDMSKMI